MNPYLAEFIGTALLVIFGNGVVANVVNIVDWADPFPLAQTISDERWRKSFLENIAENASTLARAGKRDEVV